MSEKQQAFLALENGDVYEGYACGAQGEASGELCFNTSLSGYQEVLSDPSYAGQIITMTMPQIGNYGTNKFDNESRNVFARGFVVREMCFNPSSWRSEQSLPEYLVEHNIVAIEGIDTRALVRTLRESGAMNACISTIDGDHESLVAKAQAEPGLVGKDFVSTVAYGTTYEFNDAMPKELKCFDFGEPANERFRVVAFDSGIKYNILRNLHTLGCKVTVVPPTTTAAELLAMNPDGVFLSNGPGDPEPLDYLYRTVSELIGQVPIFGICLGHQMLSLAIGATTFKLKYGHRGGNHPVKNLETGRVEITAQNHGFCVDFSSIGELDDESAARGIAADDISGWAHSEFAPVVVSKNHGRVKLTHVNLNDNSVEGIELLDKQAYSVQYHPEAAPGPHDAHYLFNKFIALMSANQS